MKPTYAWKWKRNAHRKHSLILNKDGKKIGAIRCYGGPAPWDCYEEEESWYKAYSGGKLVGSFPTMTEAKIAVETNLQVSTKKSKKPPQPELIRPVRKSRKRLSRSMFDFLTLRPSIRKLN